MGFNAAYWLLTAITAELAVIFYILLFATLIKLKFSSPDVKRPYTIPGGKAGVITVGGVGILTSLFVFIVGLLPPEQIEIISAFDYELVLISGIVVACVLPFILHSGMRRWG